MEYGIPLAPGTVFQAASLSKQFTAVFDSFTDPRKALMLKDAMGYARRHRDLLQAMADDPLVGAVAVGIEEREQVLDASHRRYGARLLAFARPALRRRGASARQQALFGALEASGRVASELYDKWTPPRLGGAVYAAILS